MQRINDKYLRQIRQIVLKEVEGRQVKVYLFGSWAEGKATPGSDVDIALEGREKIDPGLVLRLREMLEESTVPYKVDIINLHEAGENLRRRVKKTGILWKDWS